MARIITGATGLVGKHLVDHWLSKNEQLIIVGRSLEKIQREFGNAVQGITWEALTPELLKNADVVVNLAGENIANGRWTSERKKTIINSRIEGTAALIKLLNMLGNDAPPLFNASAIGIYGLQPSTTQGLPPALDETFPTETMANADFLAQVGHAWENAALGTSKVRVVLLRFGVVLASEGGALPQMIRPFKFFMGGRIGTGHQPFSWIAIDDVVRAIDFLLAQKDSQGPFNLVAPQCISQAELAEAIGRILHRPSFMRTPAIVLQTVFGKELADDLLLNGQHVYPRRLLELGFKFKYPDINSALRTILTK